MKILIALSFLASTVFAAETTERVSCTTSLSFAHMVQGGRCSMNEVMVGVESADPLMIRCARLNVFCNKQALEKFEIVQTEE